MALTLPSYQYFPFIPPVHLTTRWSPVSTSLGFMYGSRSKGPQGSELAKLSGLQHDTPQKVWSELAKVTHFWVKDLGNDFIRPQRKINVGFGEDS